jgi:DNA-binding LacI/PurR family transcriptional regulator
VPLSTIDQSTQQQGEVAAGLALTLIDRKSKSKGKHLLIEPKLIARDSTIGRTHHKS